MKTVSILLFLRRTTFLILMIFTIIGSGCNLVDQAKETIEVSEISTLYQAGQVDSAQQRLLIFTKDHKSNFLAWTILGHTYYDQEKYPEALNAYNKGVDVNAKAFEPHSGLGLVYARMGEYDKAKAAYHKADELSPNQPSVVGNLASLYDDMGEVQKSVEFGERAVKIDSTDATLVANLSYYYHKAGAIEKRDRMYKKAESLNYPDMQALTDLFAPPNDSTQVEE